MKKLNREQINNLIQVLKFQNLTSFNVCDLHEIIKSKVPTKILSEYLPFGDRRILQLANEKIIIRESNKRYNLPKSILNFIDYIKKDKDKFIENYKDRIIKAKAQREEIKLAHERGELVESEVAMESWGKIIQAFRARILAIPRKVAPLLIGCKNISESEDILKRVTNEALRELANPDLVDKVLVDNREKRKKMLKRRKQ